MAIKGVTTIQLIDGNGDVVVEQVDENLVTNTAQNLLTPLLNIQIANIYNSDVISQDSLCSSIFGGVILFDDTLTEDVTMTEIQAGKNQIGHAGGEYSGSDAMTGSYNASESMGITNGYRNVWDFATDKANGTIKSLSLCQKQLGENGGDSTKRTSQLMYNAIISLTGKYYNNKVLAILDFDVLYLDTINSVNCMCYKEHSLNPNNVKIIHDMNLNNLTPDRYIPLSQLGSTATNVASINYFVDNDYLYVTTSATGRSYIKLNLSTFEIVETIDLSFITTSGRYICGIMDGYVFVQNYTNKTIDVYDYNTQNLLKEITTTYASTAYYTSYSRFLMVKKSGKYYVSTPYTNRGTVIIIDLISETSIATYYYSSTEYVVAGTKYMLSGSGGAIYLYGNEISTINNLDTPVTKTSELTMKIIYDLTQVDESE